MKTTCQREPALCLRLAARRGGEQFNGEAEGLCFCSQPLVCGESGGSGGFGDCEVQGVECAEGVVGREDAGIDVDRHARSSVLA